LSIFLKFEVYTSVHNQRSFMYVHHTLLF
jgi:hypothetical protein